MILWLGTLGLGLGTWHAVVLTLAAVVPDLDLIVVVSALFRALAIGLFVVPPLLTGAVIAGWREGRTDDWTLHLALLSGMTMDVLTLLVLWGAAVVDLRSRDHRQPYLGVSEVAQMALLVFWRVGPGGAALGALGSGLWELFAHSPRRLRLYPR